MSDHTEATDTTEVKTRNKSPFTATMKMQGKKELANAFHDHLSRSENGNRQALSPGHYLEMAEQYWPIFEKMTLAVVGTGVLPVNLSLPIKLFVGFVDQLDKLSNGSLPAPTPGDDQP